MGRPTEGVATIQNTGELAKHLTIHLREEQRARFHEYSTPRYHLLHTVLDEMGHRVRYTDATIVVEYAVHRGSKRFLFESWADNKFPGNRVYSIALSWHLLENRHGE